VITFLLLVAGFGLYLAVCRIWPYIPCRRCRDGRHPSPSGKAWRHCSHCGGTGRQRRRFAGKPTD